MNLDFVTVIVKCCIPETNEIDFERNICNDIEKIATGGTGGSVKLTNFSYDFL